jgi:hypothetical protein
MLHCRSALNLLFKEILFVEKAWNDLLVFMYVPPLHRSLDLNPFHESPLGNVTEIGHRLPENSVRT